MKKRPGMAHLKKQSYRISSIEVLLVTRVDMRAF